MSDNIPFEMQSEIIKRLPIKSLIQFRSVCKAWKSLIESTDFIADYTANHTPVQHLLVRYEYALSCEHKYVLTIDDDTFPQQKLSSTHLLVNTLIYPRVIGSSHGLLCLYRCYHKGRDVPIGIAVLWNLLIRKAVAIVVPNVGCDEYESLLGFGVCRETNDPKIVKITQIEWYSNLESINSIPWQVEVFTLSTGAWRPPYSTILPRKSIHFGYEKVVVDGILYWLASDRRPLDGVFRQCNLIISIDMTSEEFREVTLPDNLTRHFDVSISKLRESLVVLERVAESPAVDEPPVFSVWKMEDGVPISFTKLFTFDVNKPHASVLGFRKTGEPIIQITDDDLERKLVVYEPYSKRINNLGIDGMEFPLFYVFPYMETLFLLDQPNFTVYNGTETLRF